MSLLVTRARTDQDRRITTVILVLVTGCAWLALLIWGFSPYRRFLDHQSLGQVTALDAPLVLALITSGWILMILAMMLPTTLPLVNLFRRMVRPRPDHVSLTILLISGYIAIWAVFGLSVQVIDLGIHQVVDRVEWVATHSWAIGAAIIMSAGIYQFSPLKYYCLDKCRSPFNFISAHWKGGNPRVEALRLGLHHGLFCIGCCWALMLLMFAVGMGNLGWMLALGAAMAIEKNVPSGRRLSVPLGMTLLTWGLGLVGWGLATGL